MIFLTSDIHGNIDIKKLNTKNFPEQKLLTKNDYLIINGDFGLLDKKIKLEKHYLDWLSNKNFTTLFLDGNHEDFNILNEYPIIEKFGGKVQEINPNIYHLMRGEIYTIENKIFFVMGGAESHDTSKLVTMEEYKRHKKRYTNIGYDYEFVRVIGRDWFSQEMPNIDELEYGLKNLEKYNFKVDYILSHCASNEIEEILGRKSPKLIKDNHICDYFSMLEQKVEYKHWYFGHYHQDINIDNKHTCIYNEKIKMD